MEVIKQASDVDKEITRSVTTKFVRDWRWKEWKGDGPSRSRWLRRSRLVAREYAVDKRDDVFSPASSGHLLRLLPVLYLAEVGELKKAAGKSEEETMLGTMDIKDAFLQVPQEEPLRLKMPGGDFIVLKNLPGQRIGAKAWFDYFSKFLAEELGFEACRLNPCLLRSKKAVLLVHVGDIMVKGDSNYIMNEFVPKVRSKFDASLSTMTKVGEKIAFLKRTYQRLDDGILITPGHYIENMLEVFEGVYGLVRAQKVPCDGSIQVEDVPLELDGVEATTYRSLVGMAIYLSQERLDISFTVKELASKMSRPTITAMSRLKKLLGYLKQTMGYSMKLQIPEHGRGARCTSSCGYILESYSDSDWAGNKAHRRSTSSAVHLINACTVFATSRSQRVVSLSSAEAELHALVAAVADGV